MHTNALSRNGTSYVFYYKDVLDILTHPLIEPFAKTSQLVKIIKENNLLGIYIFINTLQNLQLNAPSRMQIMANREDFPCVSKAINVNQIKARIKPKI